METATIRALISSALACAWHPPCLGDPHSTDLRGAPVLELGPRDTKDRLGQAALEAGILWASPDAEADRPAGVPQWEMGAACWKGVLQKDPVMLWTYSVSAPAQRRSDQSAASPAFREMVEQTWF